MVSRLWVGAVMAACISMSYVVPFVHAENYVSDSYTSVAPVILPGGFSTSSSFGLQGVIAQIAPGTSTATSFGDNAGFLFYPLVTTPVVTASASDAQVQLTWTAATGYAGWSVGSYVVGQATVSGGPYTYASVGNTLSTTRTGLSNGTTYYYVIRVRDALGDYIATSTEVSAAPASSGSSGGGGDGGGGGGGGGGIAVSGASPQGATLTLSGRAYPRSTVTLLKDAQVAASTVAGADAMFSITLSGVTAGNYMFSLYSEDKDGNRSSLLTFPVGVTLGATTNIGGVFIAPTIAADKLEVKRGDTITLFGQSAANSAITIVVHSETELFAQTRTDKDGVYLYNLDSSPLEIGDHTARSKSAVNNEISSFSAAAAFKVGTRNIAAEKKKACARRGDVNGDCRVNLVDFSIAAYWYGKTGVPKHIDMNGDAKMSLVDFSIMAFNWTG